MSGFQTDYLDGVEAQLRALTERGAHRSWRSRLHAALSVRDDRSGSRPGLGVLALAGPVLAAVVIAAIVLSTLHVVGGQPSGRSQPARHAAGSSAARPSGKPARGPSRGGAAAGARAGSRRRRSQRAATPAAAGTAPSGFQPESFTAISEFSWWLLGSAPCSSPPCTSIVHTVDGGRTFVGLPAPRSTKVDELRFADPFDGFAYGPQLWVTHDGAASWHRLDVGGSVTDMAFGDGFAYAIVRDRGGADGRLLRAPVDTDDWVVLTPAGDAFSGLWAHGSDVLLESQRGDGGSRLMVSHDEGASFAASTPPPNVACDFQEQLAGVVWAHCATGMLSGVWRSTDDGRRFETAVGADHARLPEQPNSAAFAAASSSTAVVGYQQLYRTTDGGARYLRASGPRGVTWWQYLGFTDATHGVALGSFDSGARERLYYTINAGASYHYVPIP